MQANLLTDEEMKGNLMEQFNSQDFGVEVEKIWEVQWLDLAKRLIGRSVGGFLLNSIRCIKSLGKGCRTQSTELYFMRQLTCM